MTLEVFFASAQRRYCLTRTRRADTPLGRSLALRLEPEVRMPIKFRMKLPMVRGVRPGFSTFQLVALAALGLALYGDLLLGLTQNWQTDLNYSHGWLVPPFAVYLAYRRRKVLLSIPPGTCWLGLPAVLLALAALVIGELGGELFVARVSLLLLIAGAVLYLRGWTYFRALLFPWLLLFLMIPLPGIVFHRLTFPLQMIASALACDILQLIQIPVLRQGNILQLAQMKLEVAEACSGIRSLVSLATFAVMIGAIVEDKRSIRFFLILSSLPIAVAANAARIVFTGIMVHLYGPVYASGFFHEFSGWIVFVLAVALLIAVQWGVHRLLVFRRGAS